MKKTMQKWGTGFLALTLALGLAGCAQSTSSLSALSSGISSISTPASVQSVPKAESTRILSESQYNDHVGSGGSALPLWPSVSPNPWYFDTLAYTYIYGTSPSSSLVPYTEVELQAKILKATNYYLNKYSNGSLPGTHFPEYWVGIWIPEDCILPSEVSWGDFKVAYTTNAYFNDMGGDEYYAEVEMPLQNDYSFKIWLIIYPTSNPNYIAMDDGVYHNEFDAEMRFIDNKPPTTLTDVTMPSGVVFDEITFDRIVAIGTFSNYLLDDDTGPLSGEIRWEIANHWVDIRTDGNVYTGGLYNGYLTNKSHELSWEEHEKWIIGGWFENDPPKIEPAAIDLFTQFKSAIGY